MPRRLDRWRRCGCPDRRGPPRRRQSSGTRVVVTLRFLVPMLWSYRQAVGGSGEGSRWADRARGCELIRRLNCVRNAALGVALATVEMHQQALARTVPIAVALVVLIAGCLQPPAHGWKTRHLACYREHPSEVVRCRPKPARPGNTQCCGGLMAILLVNVMDLHAVAVVAAATSRTGW